MFGVAPFYGGGVTVPAISLLCAVEGLEPAAPQLKSYVGPITLAVLTGLFAPLHLAPASSMTAGCRVAGAIGLRALDPWL